MQHARAELLSRQSGSLCIPGDSDGFPAEIITRNYFPRRRLIVAGVGPAALQTVKLGGFSGFETILHSPDGPTRNAAESDGIPTLAINSTTDIPDFRADGNTAIVFMFHDHEWERKLIPAALDSDAFYIGAMGSRRTHRQRLEILERQGIDPVRLARIRGPAGLFSGAKSATEIAMSIVAEIMQVARSTNTLQLVFDEVPSLSEEAHYLRFKV